MDHIIANEDKPVPDLSSVSESARSAPPPSESMDVDGDDEELAALKAVYEKAEGAGGGEGSSGAAEGAEAKSIKCSVCGKTFKTVDLANYHAEKSGHDQFEESTEEVCSHSLDVFFFMSRVSLYWCSARRPLNRTKTLLCVRGSEQGNTEIGIVSGLRLCESGLSVDLRMSASCRTMLGDSGCLEAVPCPVHPCNRSL